MTNDQDRDLSRRLDELEPPAHRPGFWADVRSELTENSTREHSASGGHFVENDEPMNSTRDASTFGGHLVENEDEPVRLDDRRRARTAPRMWLAAAAVTLVTLVGVALALDQGGENAQDLATHPTEPTDPEDPQDPDVLTAPSAPLRPDGGPIERGSGSVVGVDPTGTFLYVADEDAGGEPGCEGQPSPVLFVEPIDGGTRREVLPPDVGSATGAYRVRFGPEGELAVLTQCEGFGATIVTGTVGADGTMSDATELTIPDIELGRPVDGIVDFEFRAAGVLVASTHSFTDDGGERRHLYEFPVGPSEVTDLGQDDVVQLDVTADGRLATASTDGTIRLDGEIVGELPGVVDLAVSEDGRWVFVAREGADGLVAVDTASGVRALLTDVTVVSIESVGNDAVVAVTGDGPWTVRSVTPGDGVEREALLLDSVQPVGLAVTPDGSRLFTQLSVSGELVVIEQPLTR